ncbi:MAG: PilN domain-containing protein [Fimbriimonas sp.]
MRPKERPILGIEIHEGELRLALVSDGGQGLQVETAAHCKLAHGVLKHGTVVDTGSVAVALKRLIVSKGLADFKDAVIGIPAGGTVVRNLQVPPVPDDELSHIVAGEVEHYNIVSSTGSHSYLRIHSPSKSSSDLVPIVVAGTEANLIASLSEVAAKADLNIVALEPVEFAICRTVLATLGPEPSAFVIVVTETTTNLTFFRRGKLWAYRQLDTGAFSLQPRGKPVQADATAAAEDFPLEKSSVLALSKEIRRTLDYLGRTYPDDAREVTLHLATNEPSMVGLANLLSGYVERGIRLHIPGDSIPAAPPARADLESIQAVRYTAAIGLALRSNRAAAAVAPPLDLFAAERLVSKASAQKQRIATSLLAAGIALALGIGGMIVYERDIATRRKNIEVLSGQIAVVKQSTSEALKARAGEIEEYRLLRSEGAPVVPLMDYLTNAMPPATSLTTVTLDNAHMVRISGESVSEDGVMAVLRPLQGVPVILGPRLDSMRLDTEKNGYDFTITGTLVGMDKVKLPKSGGSL